MESDVNCKRDGGTVGLVLVAGNVSREPTHRVTVNLGKPADKNSVVSLCFTRVSCSGGGERPHDTAVNIIDASSYGILTSVST